jgi:purine-binding chemotaxis protein CheW
MGSEATIACLLCRVQARLCALPLSGVAEVMRALPIECIKQAPECVLGLSLIRGQSLPVVDAAALLGEEHSRNAYFVTIRAGERHVALAVDAVLGVRAISVNALQQVPPLFAGAPDQRFDALGVLDAELFILLQTARLVPESLWVAAGDRVPEA